MKTTIAGLIACTSLTLAACDVDQTKEGEMPKVEVNTSGGQLPEFDVEGPEVEVGSTNTTVSVPEVDVKTDEKKVEVPTVDVKTPN